MRPDGATAAWIDETVERLRHDRAVDRELPDGGRLRIDRPLPYLVVHRVAPDAPDPATQRLVSNEAALLLWAGDADDPTLAALVRAIVEWAATEHGAILLVEVWARTDAAAEEGEGEDDFEFRIRAPATEAPGTVETLAEALRELCTLHPALRGVRVEPSDDRHPPGTAPLLSIPLAYRLESLLIGIEVPAVYLQPGAEGRPGQRREGRRAYPVFLRRFAAAFSHALRRTVFDFLRVQTDAHVANYRMLGPSTVAGAAWDADRALAEIQRTFDFLLLVSPINEDAAWHEFRSLRFEDAPTFRYRLLPVDPDHLKQRLHGVDLDPVDDPAMRYLLAEKRDELDKKISMLAERGSPAFLYSSIRLYQPVDDGLLRTARALLARASPPAPAPAPPASSAPLAPPAPAPSPDDATIDAEGFRARALAEFERYRAQWPAFRSDAQIRPDVAGLLVSRGRLLIDERLRIDPDRVEALVHHEVGTHVLTWVNGSAQPLRQLASGLAGYDELQEALAVLAEYLAGGLTARRMRILAARVVAAHAVENGADFVQTFRRLTGEDGLPPRRAFDVTQRVFHGGGFTRDLIYLRGFLRLLERLRTGDPLEPLYIGKIAERHVAIVQELRDRGILHDPPLRPRLLESEQAALRLRRLRDGVPLARLLQ